MRDAMPVARDRMLTPLERVVVRFLFPANRPGPEPDVQGILHYFTPTGSRDLILALRGARIKETP